MGSILQEESLESFDRKKKLIVEVQCNHPQRGEIVAAWHSSTDRQTNERTSRRRQIYLKLKLQRRQQLIGLATVKRLEETLRGTNG